MDVQSIQSNLTQNQIINKEKSARKEKNKSIQKIVLCQKKKKDIVIFSVISVSCAVIVLIVFYTNRQEDNNENPNQYSNSTSNKTDNICPYVGVIGDDYCDDEANTEDCLYDLGDCCSVENDLTLCKECFCYEQLDPLHLCNYSNYISDHKHLGDGDCHMTLNIPEYFFDVGDCCLNKSLNRPDDICVRSNIYCVTEELGDGKCQDYNNGKLCDFDLGDCCAYLQMDWQNYQNINNFHEYCCACMCHAAWPAGGLGLG